MGFFFFYGNRKPRQYEHKPIYWDPNKEKLQERIDRIKRQLDEEDGKIATTEEYKPQIKGAFLESSEHIRRQHERGRDSKYRSSRSMTLLLFLVILLVVLWVLYFK